MGARQGSVYIVPQARIEQTNMAKTPQRIVKIGKIYKHFKGSLVKVLLEAFDSETKEPLVVYKHLEDGKIWVRPRKMFLGKVRKEGKTRERFSDKTRDKLMKQL
jgi:hypothetical protein